MTLLDASRRGRAAIRGQVVYEKAGPGVMLDVQTMFLECGGTFTVSVVWGNMSAPLFYRAHHPHQPELFPFGRSRMLVGRHLVSVFV